MAYPVTQSQPRDQHTWRRGRNLTFKATPEVIPYHCRRKAQSRNQVVSCTLPAASHTGSWLWVSRRSCGSPPVPSAQTGWTTASAARDRPLPTPTAPLQQEHQKMCPVHSPSKARGRRGWCWHFPSASKANSHLNKSACNHSFSL